MGYEYIKCRIQSGYDALEPILKIIKSYNINYWTNNIPNLFKIIEDIQSDNEEKFIQAGIDKKSQDCKQYKSFVANAITEDILDMGYDSVTDLMECIEIIDEYTVNTGKLFKLHWWHKLLDMFAIKEYDKISEEEMKEISEIIKEPVKRCYAKYEKFENYKIEEYVVNAVVKLFQQNVNKDTDDARIAFVDFNIEEDIKKLGLEHLCPEIFRALSKIYKIDLANAEKNKAAKEYLDSLEDDSSYTEEMSEEEYEECTQEEQEEALKNRLKIKITTTKKDSNDSQNSSFPQEPEER